MATRTLPAAPRSTANPAPARPFDSIRRTSSIDVSWPEGESGDRLFIGRVRDYRTPASGGPGHLIDEAEFRAMLAQDKTITSIATTPTMPSIDALVGMRGGNHLRLFMKEKMPELIDSGAPIYLALDDISGTSLVSGFAWSQFHDDWTEHMRKTMGDEAFDHMMANRTNVCWGLKEGHSGITDGPSRNLANAEAGDVRNPADPEGWHALPENDGAGFRRARRIDVTRDAASGVIRIDAAFQDSASRPDGGRVAIHEYNLAATADPDTLEILTLDPEARVLPYPECPGAIHNTRQLIGSRIGDIRDEVLALLRGPQGCTHLNDALRALAEVPRLAGFLQSA